MANASKKNMGSGAQGKRDGTGDTYLYLLITQDVRMSW